MPKAIESFDFSKYDLVLSDSSSFAKGIKTDKLHICYCHTPTRFLWTEPEYLDYQRYPAFLKFFGKSFLPRLEKWDYQAAQRPNFFIANSENVKNRIRKFYHRDSDVIPPPVNTDFFKPVGEKKDYFFTVARLEPYKKIDVIVQAFNELGLPLKIAGSGSVADQLKSIAKPNIEFIGRVSDEELRQYYSASLGFVFAAEEDAGIVMLEAQACGTPVIAYGKGGALEAVQEGVTGEFFGQQSVPALVEGLKKFEPAKYDGQKIREHAMQFDKKIFQQKIKTFVEEKYAHRT
jgi:glycosyltransferase involved in cell wall biosynthesis